jgi:hypothetical protein
MQTALVSNTNSIPTQKMTKITTQNETRELSSNALYIINSHYKDNSILIQYANENKSFYGNPLPEMENRTLHVILHVGYNLDKQNGLCIPVFQYDTIHFQYNNKNDCIPEYCIDTNAIKYHNMVDKELF